MLLTFVMSLLFLGVNLTASDLEPSTENWGREDLFNKLFEELDSIQDGNLAQKKILSFFNGNSNDILDTFRRFYNNFDKPKVLIFLALAYQISVNEKLQKDEVCKIFVHILKQLLEKTIKDAFKCSFEESIKKSNEILQLAIKSGSSYALLTTMHNDWLRNPKHLKESLEIYMNDPYPELLYYYGGALTKLMEISYKKGDINILDDIPEETYSN